LSEKVDLKKLRELSSEFTVLYVEDENDIRKTLFTYMSKFFKTVDTAINGKDGLELYTKNSYDLVVTDINMPIMSGLDMAAKIKDINQNQNILIVSAYSDTDNFITSIKIGIDGYILKPIDYKQLNTSLYNISNKIKIYKENIEYKINLEQLVEDKIKNIKDLEKDRIENYKKTLYALINMIENRDTYTGGHSLRVARYSKLIAKQMKLDDEKCEAIYQAGILHDIGKVAIPDNILLKPGILDDLEYKLIQEHVNIGVKMLQSVPMFEELSLYIEAHHEKLDGSGYPKGLKNNEISLESQILAVSDAFDAMTTSRIYKSRKSIEKALQEIESLKNKQFRSDVVESALIVLKEIVIDDNINQLPTTNIEKERFSYFYKDQVTQAYNSNYLDLILMKNNYDIKYKYINVVSIHNLNNINSKYGWKDGDKYLKFVVNSLQNIYRNNLVFRIYSDDFLILSKNEISLDKDTLTKIICRDGITFELMKYNIAKNKILSLHDFELLN